MAYNVLKGTVKAIDPSDRYRYNPDDLAKRVYPDGREEYVLLPKPGGTVPAQEGGFQIGDIYENESGQKAKFIGDGKWELQ